MIVVCYGGGSLTRVFAWRPVRRLGNISYSLFLTHTIPIFFVVNVLGTRWPGPDGPHGLWPAFALAALALAGAIVLAAALFVVAERPYFRARVGHARVVDGSLRPGMRAGLSANPERGTHAASSRP
jgi:peptidoglycan/LPS O-acetylase OafA/YrhL